MNQYNRIKRKYYNRYSLGLERIIASATNRNDLLRKKTALAKELQKQFEEETQNLPFYMKRRTVESKVASKIEEAYTASVEQIIEEEPKRRSVILQRVKQTENLARSNYELMVKREKKSQDKRIWAGMVASVVALGIFVGTFHGKKQETPAQSGDSGVETTQSETVSVTESTEETLKMPEIKSYENVNGTFQYLDNTVDVNYWAYETVKREVEAYNKANPEKAYKIDMNLLNGAILCGIQIRESSGQLNSNKENPNYQGPYSISTQEKYVSEINEVAKDLTGKNVIDINNIKKDIQDPRIGAKACIYQLIKNYEYLKTILPENVEITSNMLVDSYLYGASGVKRRVVSGEYKGAMPYSSRIFEYANEFKVYKSALDEKPYMRELDSTPEGRIVFQNLAQISNRYAGIDTHQRNNGAASEMD